MLSRSHTASPALRHSVRLQPQYSLFLGFSFRVEGEIHSVSAGAPLAIAAAPKIAVAVGYSKAWSMRNMTFVVTSLRHIAGWLVEWPVGVCVSVIKNINRFTSAYTSFPTMLFTRSRRGANRK